MGWKTVQFADLVRKVSTSKLKLRQKEYLDSGRYPVVDQGKNHIGGYTNDASKVIHAKYPLIVFGDHSRSVKILRQPFAPGADGTKVLEPRDSVDAFFLYFLTKYLSHKIANKGYARHYQYLAKETVNLPPLPEQRAIAAKLDELLGVLDRSVGELRGAAARLGVYRESVLREAFAGRLTEEWREIDSTVEVPPPLIEKQKFTADLSSFSIELPPTWKVVALGNLSNGVQYGTSSKSLKTGSTPVLRMGNMQNGKIDWSDLKYTDDQGDIEKYQLSKGDVLFNRTNSPEWVGKTVIYQGEQPAIFAGYLIRVNHEKSAIDSSYLNYYLNSHYAKMHGNRVKTDGVNQSNINGKKLSAYPIPLPSLPEQRRIVSEIESRLSVAGALEREVAGALARAEGLRMGVLKRAFGGELV